MSHLEIRILLIGFVPFTLTVVGGLGKPWGSLKQGLMLVHFNIVAFYFGSFFVTVFIFKFVIKYFNFATITFSPLACLELRGILDSCGKHKNDGI